MNLSSMAKLARTPMTDDEKGGSCSGAHSRSFLTWLISYKTTWGNQHQCNYD